ncbi:MAG: TlpA family protein disulfide reductase [Candidatus Kapaibacterium sp.]
MNNLYRSMTAIILSAVVAVGFCSRTVAQTAPDFSLEDCDKGKHSLYQDLDAGKVVVIVWVMPCGACAMPMLTTNGVVKELNKTYPGKVKLYILDDFGDTECASLVGWLKNYSITTSGGYATVATTPSVPMTDYGAIGMPKIIAVSGAKREIIYRSENDVDGFVLRDKIVERLATAGTDLQAADGAVTVLQHPVRERLELTVGDAFAVVPTLTIRTMTGMDVAAGTSVLAEGRRLSADVAHLSSGAYVAVLRSDATVRTIPFIVLH